MGSSQEPLNSCTSLGVALVQWNKSDLTLSLLQELIIDDTISHIVVLDNGSDVQHWDALLEFQEQQSLESSRLTVFRNRTNSGFARGVNVCLQHLIEKNCDWIWVLNNDVSVKPESLKCLTNFINSLPEPAIYSTEIHEDGNSFTGNYAFNHYTARISPISNSTDLNQTPQEARYVSGASMLVHSKVFVDVGGLNEQYFLYYEELDFVKRALRYGYLQQHLSGCLVEHMGGQSTQSKVGKSTRFYNEIWSGLAFYSDHHKLLFYFFAFIRVPLKSLYYRLFGEEACFAISQAKSDFLKGFHKYHREVNIVDSNL